jgi:exodeoxyribonuclease-1
MGFVFYDTETTGISTDFDQILQFAAIHTDVDLNELDRLEIRCRLQPHVLPHPGALRVTGMTIEQVTDNALPCHYDMIRTVRAKLLSWSPAIFVGYNSLSFDEKLLRQALFQTLHSPYLTNTNGNCRATRWRWCKSRRRSLLSA